MKQSFPLLGLLHLLFLLLPPKSTAQVGVGGGIGVWIDGGGGGRGGRRQQRPPPPASTEPSKSSEYAALQALKAAITEDPNGALASWTGPNVCAYRGVSCSAPPEPSPSGKLVVAGVDLNHANLRGSLPGDLSLLAQLTFLHLNSNRLAGAVPDSFAGFQFLTELDLSNNLLAGPFPEATLLIPSLIYLDLRFNRFSGELPDELFQKDLDAIFLNNNEFQGQIPMGLWSSPASVITLANNRLTGAIPAAYGYANPAIREVLFLNNSLTGCIPEGLGFLGSVQVLDLSFNALSGRLPPTLSCMAGIEVLNVAHNRLSGELPDMVCALRRLANLTVAFNFFSGLSQDCSRLAGTEVFDFAGNCIPGRNMQRPSPECSEAPGDGGLSCLRIPGARPVGCAQAAAIGAAVLPFTLQASASLPGGAAVTITVP